MRHKASIVFLLSAGLLASLQIVAAQERSRERGDFLEQDEFRETYKIAPGAVVEVRNINGPLEIETTQGDSAEVYVVRSARTREDLEYRKVIVETTGNTFRVYTEEPPDEIRSRISVRHRAVVKVPRPSELTVRNINGRARIGEIDGPALAGNINGSLEISHLAGFAELTNINGSINLTLERLGQRGIRMRNINGSVNFRFLDQPNADLDFDMFNGSVDSEAATVSARTRSSYRGKIGSGGVPITGSHVNGTVRFRGASER